MMINTKQNSIDEYIAGFPEEIQVILNQVRTTIKKSAPDAVEKISYAMPTFFLNGNLVHFAAFQNHIGFYPTPSGIENFKKEISKYKWSKGAVQFPINEPMPLKLIEEIIKFRVRENQQKVKKK
ncbi:MAG: DUF1801 domain-containing protein [Candidatus Kapabacteria bacterium]|nr:DUF1801 domain-containing protein [Candidatus Kapabacteria bacterium]